MKKPSLFEILVLFLKVGTFGFGGGAALISVIQEEIVDKRKWMESDEYIRGIGMSFLPPGAIIINLSFFVGYSLRGFIGGLTAMFAMLIPSFIIVVILGIIVVKYGSLAANTGIIRGIAPAVMGILIAVVIKMCQDQVRNKWGYLAVLVVFALIFLLKINPVFLILTSVIIAVVCRFLYKGGKDNAA